MDDTERPCAPALCRWGGAKAVLLSERSRFGLRGPGLSAAAALLAAAGVCAACTGGLLVAAAVWGVARCEGGGDAGAAGALA